MIRSMLAVSLFIAVVTVLIAGCPPPPKPPFDVSGDYEGTWSGTSTDNAQQVEDCVLSLSLTQNVNATFPTDHVVNGTVTVDYSCITLPDWVEDPVPSVLNVTGYLQDNGKLTLVTGGCTTALCVVLTLDGTAQDNGSDGFADTYSGTWNFTILLAGVEPFGFTGDFSVAVAP
ncbi:MAG: hypothetical protein K1Y02_19450 [Candidatus Hydrogenedentes bacterium]|nr:hypothetical protein [Candidatus Hydrogenedentota bacterium]